MPCRVNSAEVREIIDTSIQGDLLVFITPANTIINSILGTTYTEEYLKEIERWLSAHFVAVRDPRLRSRAIGDARETYAISGGYAGGLDSTPYGQQVAILDYLGILKKSLGKKCAIFEAVSEDYQ